MRYRVKYVDKSIRVLTYAMENAAKHMTARTTTRILEKDAILEIIK